MRYSKHALDPSLRRYIIPILVLSRLISSFRLPSLPLPLGSRMRDIKICLVRQTWPDYTKIVVLDPSERRLHPVHGPPSIHRSSPRREMYIPDGSFTCRGGRKDFYFLFQSSRSLETLRFKKWSIVDCTYIYISMALSSIMGGNI